MQNKQLRNSYKQMINSITGWHNYRDFLIAADIINYLLAKKGHAHDNKFLEIGIFHGRSFIPVFHYFHEWIDCFYACDTFADRGQLEIFKANVDKYLPIGKEKIQIIREDSMNLNVLFPHDQGGEFFYCSIDGNHSYETTFSDITFCAERLEENGLILLDDVFQGTWPEVSLALYDFLRLNSEFNVSFILFNKVVLTRDNSIVEDLFDEKMFKQSKLRNRPVNVVNLDFEKDTSRSFFTFFDRVWSR